ncbi:MAG: PAS domain-containing sensor histidine kinase [Neptuniibacter sp.]
MSDDSEQTRYKDEAARYRQMFEQSTDMLSRHTATPEWIFIDVNPACEKLLGFKPDELIGSSSYEQIHPDDADNLIERADSVHYRHGMYTNVHRYRHKDGFYVWLETTSRTIRDDSGNPLEIICVSRDVSEREIAQQATRRLARVVEASSDMILFCNHDDQKITYMNESSLNTLELQEIPGPLLLLKDLFSTEDYKSEVKPALDIAANSGKWLGSIKMQLPGPVGGTKYAEVREIIGHHNRNKAEHPVVEYYTFIARDITEQRTAQEKASKQQQEITHMSRFLSVGEMATGLAHELNQPLAAIINYCRGTKRRLKANPTDDPVICEAMELIAKQAKRASEIIKRMRSFVRKTDSKRTTFSINKSCQDVSNFLLQEAKENGISFEFELDKNIPGLYADQIQIEQVLLNLIRNAIEAYSNTRKTLRPVAIATFYQEGYFEIIITDAAGGISEEELGGIFEPFRTSKSNGLGMGLPISQTIIENHSGQIWVESDGVTGTEFKIRLPFEEQK